MADILIIEDDPTFSGALALTISRLGHRVGMASRLDQGISEAQNAQYDLVLLDVNLPDGNGLDGLDRIRNSPGAPEVIIMTGLGDPDGAELAIRSGAWDYLEKDGSMKRVILPVTRALEYRRERLQSKPRAVLRHEGLIGESPALRSCLDLMAQAATSESPVLITGETGTGKELFALAIHQNGIRGSRNFVVVDCAALPETLVESLLFGHEKGAFTGADSPREGLIRQADGGTLFLDEVGELPLGVQARFLRALEEKSFRPLGSPREVQSDFRLIAATHRDLERMAGEGKFRQDLLFRLKALTIDLPPLRSRGEDIRDIAIHHVSRICVRYGLEMKAFSPDFFDSLQAYDWPGNIRQLIHALERAVVSARYESTLFPKHLPTDIRVRLARSGLSGQEKVAPSSESGRTQPASEENFMTLGELRQSRMTEVERQYLKDLWDFTGGDIDRCCTIAGLSRSRLYALLQKYRIAGRS